MNNAGSKQLTDCGNEHYHNLSDKDQRKEKFQILPLIIKEFCLIGKIGQILSFAKRFAHCKERTHHEKQGFNL